MLNKKILYFARRDTRACGHFARDRNLISPRKRVIYDIIKCNREARRVSHLYGPSNYVPYVRDETAERTLIRERLRALRICPRSHSGLRRLVKRRSRSRPLVARPPSRDAHAPTAYGIDPENRTSGGNSFRPRRVIRGQPETGLRSAATSSSSSSSFSRARSIIV